LSWFDYRCGALLRKGGRTPGSGSASDHLFRIGDSLRVASQNPVSGQRPALVPTTASKSQSRIPFNAPTKSGDQDVEVTEKKHFPVSGFPVGEFGAWQRQKKGPGENTALRRIKNSGVICCARSTQQMEILVKNKDQP
jgi:hypothetical protein